MIANRGDAVAYLDSLIGSGIRPGLDRMRRVLDAAGNPERSVPAVLVAGTNGKGSTAATLSAIVHAAGYKVGLYTSPHLVELEERWRIAEKSVSSAALIRGVERLRSSARIAGLTPTYFEAVTILAFFVFEESECEIAILEVGMGGRLDATNVVDPLLSIITRIDLDHQEWLGDTIEAIAIEKLGITRRGTPVVIADQHDGVVEMMRGWCDEHGCSAHFVGEDVRVISSETGLGGTSMELATTAARYDLHSPLVGIHQVGNVSAAILGAELLASRFENVDAAAMTAGTSNTQWRGRLESFHLEDRLVIVDGAHNPAGTASAAKFVATLPGPRALVFGALADKDVSSMLASFEGLFDHVVFTTPDSDRSADPESLRSLVAWENVQVIGDDEEAIITALRDSNAATVLICGSLYLAGSAIRLLDTIASPSA